eukprot:364253-Chlamydomonas_euryale.AAC.2
MGTGMLWAAGGRGGHTGCHRAGDCQGRRGEGDCHPQDDVHRQDRPGHVLCGAHASACRRRLACKVGTWQGQLTSRRRCCGLAPCNGMLFSLCWPMHVHVRGHFLARGSRDGLR